MWWVSITGGNFGGSCVFWHRSLFTVITVFEILVRDLISFISYLLLKERNLVAYENHTRMHCMWHRPSCMKIYGAQKFTNAQVRHYMYELDDFCDYSIRREEWRQIIWQKGLNVIPQKERYYSAFRQKFPKLWTSVAHSFLQQIAQNKNWAHQKFTTLPRICKVEMQQASLLYYSAKPQSGGILGCALVCPTSLYVRTILFPTFFRSLPSVGA